MVSQRSTSYHSRNDNFINLDHLANQARNENPHHIARINTEPAFSTVAKSNKSSKSTTNLAYHQAKDLQRQKGNFNSVVNLKDVHS